MNRTQIFSKVMNIFPQKFVRCKQGVNSSFCGLTMKDDNSESYVNTFTKVIKIALKKQSIIIFIYNIFEYLVNANQINVN